MPDKRNADDCAGMDEQMNDAGWNLEHTYADLPEMLYKKQYPTAVKRPQMVVFNDTLARMLGLDADMLKNTPEVFAGNVLPPDSVPIAQGYAGYQFGYFAMLGDGRAVLLGEQVAPNGERYDIQLKGCGRTPYSRGGDGRAALSPMLREYIISEAMHHLGIPTTRSLAVALTGEQVVRETALQGAVLTRVAASHVRVGTFNHVSAHGTHDDLRKLADYCVTRHHPHLENEVERYMLLLREIADRQAKLIAGWQLVGFVHGVMNTDNMAISGETIDYGPCAFMDAYNPDVVFSSIDTQGRYAYKNQPTIGAWNLSRLAESMLPLLDSDGQKAVELAQNEITRYQQLFHKYRLAGMLAKLGIANEMAGDENLVNELLDIMKKNKLDYTNTFRALCFATERAPDALGLPDVWLEKWRSRLKSEPQGCDAADMMKRRNPAVVPRNHRVEEALAAAERGDLTVMFRLLDALREPYNDSEYYSQPPAPSACRYRTFCGT